MRFIDVRFDCLSFDEALEAIRAPLIAGQFRYAVTPNIDHVVRLHQSHDPEVKAAYDGADLSFCDSQVLRFLARPFGIHLSTVTGSDLLLRLIPDLLSPGDSINLVGGDDDLVEQLRAILPITRITTHFPPMGMLGQPAAMAAAVEFMESNPADYTLLCCGSPQQEILAYRAKQRGRTSGMALCIGAAVEFLVKRKPRAPLFMRRIGLEWLHRLLSEPRRLWKRYLVRSPGVIPLIVRWEVMRRLRGK